MRAALLPLLLAAFGCHPPFQDSTPPEGDTDADTDADSDTDVDADSDVDNPPATLCEEGAVWGWLDTDLSTDQDGEVRYVTPGSEIFLTYRLEGVLDLCAIDCSPHWLDDFYITDSKTYDTVIELPRRMTEDEVLYYYMHVDVPDDAEDTEEHCYLETSAGKHWVEFVIRN